MFNSWGSGEEKQFTTNLSTFDTEEGAGAAFGAAFDESWEAGPTKSLYNYGRNLFAEKNLTGEEANSKYNLGDSPIAYKPEDQVSEFEARTAADRHFEKRLNDSTMANASENTWTADVTSFAGSLAGGIVDPVNLAADLATGATLGSLMRAKTASMGIGRAMQVAARKNPFMESVVRNGLESFVGSVAVDLVAVPLGEEVTRQKTTAYQRALNVVGGTLMGTSFGVGMDSVMGRASRLMARSKSRKMGSTAPDIMEENLQHSMMNVENGKRPNNDYIEEKYDIEYNTDRPHQQPYEPVELSAENVTAQDYFVGKRTGSEDLDHAGFGGDSGYVITDNANLVHNRVSSLDGKVSGEMMHVKMNKDAKILTQDIFDGDEVRTALPDSLANVLKKHGYEGDVTENLRLQSEGVDTLDDLIDLFEDNLESIDGLPDATDMMNMALSDMGFDGYKGTIPSKAGKSSNSIVLFKNSDGSVKGLDSLSDPVPTTKFDPNHPKSEMIKQSLAEHKKAELARVQSHKSDLDYDAEAVAAANDAPDMTNVSEDFENFADMNGIDKDNLDDVGFTENQRTIAEAVKSADSHQKAVLGLFSCIRGRS